MISLEEYAKVCGLISSCNDIINGKFILADYKIANILKNITASKEVYNLLSNCLNTFDFEREFSRAQLRSASKPNRFVLPSEPDKILPFVFCVLVNINNKNLDFDLFLKEFYRDENENHSKEYTKFANEVILPFRDLIAKHFEIPIESVATIKVQPLKSTEKEIKMEEKNDDLKKSIPNVELQEENEEQEKKEYAELTADKVQQFLTQVNSTCEQIVSELTFDHRTKADLKEDIIYLVETMKFNTKQEDLKNTIALIIAFEYLTVKAKSLRFYARELKNILVNFYEE